MASPPQEVSLNAEFLVDPYPVYDLMRAEAPAHKVRLAGTDVEAWLITRWEVARAAMTDPRLTKIAAKAGFSLAATKMPLDAAGSDQMLDNMIFSDPPEHHRLRQPVHKVFTAARVQALRDWVQDVTEELIDRVAPLGRADIVADLSRPLPVAVIAELLGTPRERRPDLHRWSRSVVAAPGTEEAFAADRRALREVRDYLQEIIAVRRREPDGGVVSALIEARDDETGEPLLTDEELQSTIFLLLFAGLENVGDLISNGTLALLRHPDQLDRLRQDPGLLPTAVDEFLRYDSPGNITTWRFALEDFDLGGAAVRRGEPVLIAMPAVNRDPARFPDPHRLDLERTDNPHISFGHGIHHCPGLHLARLEGEVAIGTILRRMPDLELAVPVEELVYKPSVLVRGLEALPVRFTPT